MPPLKPTNPSSTSWTNAIFSAISWAVLILANGDFFILLARYIRTFGTGFGGGGIKGQRNRGGRLGRISSSDESVGGSAVCKGQVFSIGTMLLWPIGLRGKRESGARERAYDSTALRSRKSSSNSRPLGDRRRRPWKINPRSLSLR